MKKTFIFILSIAIVSFFLVSCGHRHDWSGWKITQNPTCSEKGLKERVCECGEKEVVEIFATGLHSFGEWFIVAIPSVTATGLEERYCSICDYKDTRLIDKLPDIIYYSDLFYGYDTSYLMNDYIEDYYDDVDDVARIIFNDYINSPKYIWTQIETSVAAALSAREFFELMSDAYLDTSFNYSDAMDSANIIFAQHLLGENTGVSPAKNDAKVASRIKKLINLFDEFAKIHDPKTPDEITITKFYTFITEEGVFHKIGFDTITTVKGQLLSDINNIKNQMNVACTTLDIIQAITLGMMMEEIRLDMLDSIIESCPYDGTLYEGMTRLRKQLQGGCASYIIHNYFQDEFINSLSKTVTKALTSSLSAYSLVSSCLEVASWVVFDVLVDVPDMDDMLVQMVLNEYVDGFHFILNDKISLFKLQFDSDDILEYESLVEGFDASCRALLKASEKLTLSSNYSNLVAVKNEHKSFSYDNYIKVVKDTIFATPYAERRVKTYSSWEISEETSIVPASDTVDSGNLYLFYNAFNGSLLLYDLVIIETPFGIIRGSIDISLRGNMIIQSGGSYIIDGNLTLVGDSRYDGLPAQIVKIEEGAILTINGDTRVGNGYGSEEIINDGKLIFFGNVNVSTYSRITVEETSTNAEIIFYKDLNNSTQSSSVLFGTVVFVGNEKQNVSGLLASTVIIENKSADGVTFNTSICVSKLFNHNGNNFTLYNDGRGSTFVDYDGDGKPDNVDPYPTDPNK